MKQALFFWKYLNENVSPSVRELHLCYSSCRGQNTNHCITFLLELTGKRKFDKIINLFLFVATSFWPMTMILVRSSAH